MAQKTINNYTFYSVESGQGEPVIFVHGSGSDYRTWEKQMQEFSKHFHCITYSRRFHRPNKEISENEDYSMRQHVDDLAALIESLDQKPVHLVGHSYGAFICLLLAADSPALTRSLTLAEPPVITLYVSNTPKPGEILKLLVSNPRAALGIVKLGATGIAPAAKALNDNEYDKAQEIMGKATLGKNTYKNLSKSRYEQARSNLIKAEITGSGFPPVDKNKIRDIGVPTLLIEASNSRNLFHHLLNSLQRLMPRAERKVIPDSSHIMHEDNPSMYNSVVLSFLKKHFN